MKKAVIDIGTNSVRMLVGDFKGDRFEPINYRVEITRLGEGIGRERKLASKAVKRTLKIIRAYLREIKDRGVDNLWITATSAVREADNKEFFISLVKEETGQELKVLSEDEEAKLSYGGVIKSLPGLQEEPLVFDLGGGSTEFIWKEKGEVTCRSCKIGVVRLTEAFLHSDPPSLKELERLTNHTVEILKNLEKEVEIKGEKLVGVGGTITSLAAVRQELQEYDPDRIHGFVLKREEMEMLLKKFISIEEKDRKEIYGLQPQRADVIIAGTLAIMAIMDNFQFKEVTVSEGDILLGILNSFN